MLGICGQVPVQKSRHDATMTTTYSYPVIRPVGFDGALVTFSQRMTEPSNRAALAYRSAIEQQGWCEILETSASLTSAYVRFDPLRMPYAEAELRLNQLLGQRDWYSAALPAGRRLWRVPTVYGTELAPQLDEAADAAGLTPTEAIQRISQTKVRVLTIGFAPGQPYLGPLGPEFDIPRLPTLTPMVPEGALVLAIAQMVLFSGPTPTGWRHVGQTAFRCFRPDQEQSFALRPGDEMLFEPVSRAELEAIGARDTDGSGGATCTEIAS